MEENSSEGESITENILKWNIHEYWQVGKMSRLTVKLGFENRTEWASYEAWKMREFLTPGSTDSKTEVYKTDNTKMLILKRNMLNGKEN